MFKRILLTVIGPMVVNQLLGQITGDKINEWLDRGMDELKEAIVKMFDRLAEKAAESSNTVDDAVVTAGRVALMQLLDAIGDAGLLLDLVEEGLEACVELAERSDNELDDMLAQGALQAVKDAKDGMVD